MTWYKQASADKIINNEMSSRLQEEWMASMGDFQRAPTDAYQCYVHLSETNYKITVCASIMTVHSGTMMLQMFWKYGLNEKSAAKKTYEQIKKQVATIIEDITKTESPSSLFESMVRVDCSKIATDKIARTNIPHINWSQNVKYERDWRSSIYGNRYPHPNEINGF